MIPYFTQPVIELGPLSIHGFGIAVAVAVILGEYLATSRAKKVGLDPAVTDSMVWWALIIGFIGAHLYSVFFYFPDRLMREPLFLFKIWDGISSLGGMLGGLFGVWLYFRLKQPKMPGRQRLAYLDTVAWAFPFAWVFGRLGCTMAHDHPGVVTNFPLSISLKTEQARAYIQAMYADMGRLAELPPDSQLATMGFFDLGLIEFLYTLIVMAPVFWVLGRKNRAPGFFIALFLILYMPVRFVLDFLRLVDVTYFGLTPAQWASIPVFLAAIFVAVRVLPREQAAGGDSQAPARS